MLDALRQVAKAEGLLSLWKGNIITILHRVPYSAINFCVYESTKEHLRPIVSSDVGRRLLSGGAAGLVACTAVSPTCRLHNKELPPTSALTQSNELLHLLTLRTCPQAYPLDLVRTRTAAEVGSHKYRRLLPALNHIVVEEGARGIYKGLPATLAQVVPGLALTFCFYDTFRQALVKQERPNPWQSILCASVSGLCTSSLTFPLDVVRRRMQVRREGGAYAYASPHS
jgi:solute carrier family 25 phosphate transporter 23/24/25/41